jgi:NADH-quinone oxidoreductase subunit N
VLALAFTVFLLSQAGVPLTSGFFAKFYVIGAAADARSYALAIIAMITAVVSAFLYLRIIVAMYFSGDEVDADAATGRSRIAVPWGAALSLGVAIAVTLVVGILPQALSDVARDAVPVLVSAGP